VTFKDFEEFGLDRHSIRPAIAELDALGFIRITQHGRAGNADFRIPNKFRLTHQHANDGAEPATNEWRRIKTLEEAENIAKLARLVGGGPKQKKQKSSEGFSTSPRWEKSTSKPGFQGGKNPPRGTGKTPPLSISRGGAATSTGAVDEPAAEQSIVLEPPGKETKH
jgi:hypothetical protein